MSPYYIDNGELVEVGGIISTPPEKGIIETMRYSRGRIFFFKEHMNRLRSTIRFVYPDEAQRIDPQSIFALIEQLIFKSEIKEDVKIRLIVSEQAKIRIEAISLQEDELKWNVNGLRVGIFPDEFKNNSAYSKFKLVQQTLSHISKGFALQYDWDECIWLNQDKKVIETDISNIFIVQTKNDQTIVKTPPVQDGCVEGIMRAFMIELMHQKQTRYEIDSLTLQDLKTADEIFLTNAVSRIRWVSQFEEKKYSNKVSKRFFDQHEKKADSS